MLMKHKLQLNSQLYLFTRLSKYFVDFQVKFYLEILNNISINAY